MYLEIFLNSFLTIISLMLLRRCWEYYKRYKDFPSVIFDMKFMRKLMSGKYPQAQYIADRSLNLMYAACSHFETEGLFYVWFIMPMLFVFNEDYVKVLLNHDSALNRTPFYGVLSGATGNGILTKDEREWRPQRKIMNPAFKFEMLRNQVNFMNQSAKDAVRRISLVSNQPTVDVLHIIKTCALRAICETVFGTDMNDEEHKKKYSEVDRLISCLEMYTIYRYLRPWLWLQKAQLLFEEGRKHQVYYRELANFTKCLLDENLKSRSTSDGVDSQGMPFNKKSLFQILYDHHLNEPSFTMKKLQDEIQTMIVAGHDTVSQTMHWCLFFMAVHPEVQEKAFEEVNSVIGSSDSDVSYNDLNELKYLDAVIKETLRLIPVLPIFSRKLRYDVECGKYKIPKDTSIFFFLLKTNRNKDNYPDPDNFDPRRFYEKTVKHPWSYVPFAEGIRGCIGKNYALMVMKIFLAQILRRFKITSLEKKEDVKAAFGVVLKTEKAIHFIFTSR